MVSSSFSHFMGSTLGGKYVVKQLLGHGGMGAVFLGSQRFGTTERSVAIKLLTRDPNLDPAALKRFYREVEVVGMLSHPNSIRIYDFGQTDDGLPFMVMEFLEGQSLKEVIQTDAPIPLTRCAHVIAQVCDALAEAHEKGIVHRDLKPANIFLLDQVGKRDFVKVLDFGLAKDLRLWAESSVTIKGSIAGSPPYLSPEQIDGTAIDLRSDVYSLGVVLFEMATGTRPYLAKDPVGLFMQHMDAPIPSARERAPDLDLPPALDHLLLRALAKKPEGRPNSVLDFKRELQDCLKYGQTATAPSMGALLPSENTVTSFRPAEVTERFTIDETTRRLSVEQLQPTPADSPRAPADPVTAGGAATTPFSVAVATEGELESPFSNVRTNTESFSGPGAVLGWFRHRRLALTIGLAAVAVTAAVGLVAFYRASRDDPADDPLPSTTQPAQPAPAVRPAAPDAAAAVLAPTPDAGRPDAERPRAPRRVRLIVDSQPHGASVQLDGVEICRTPCQTEVAPRRTGQLLLQQSGFRDLRREVELSGERNDLGTLKLSPIRQRTGNDHKKDDKTRPGKTGDQDELMPIE